MNTNIYNNKIIVFETKAIDALKAATTIDSYTYTYVMMFDNVVMVSFDNDVEEPKYKRTLNDLIEKCINVLKKYNIEYKIKGMKF
jgi:hypothetical protein